MNTRRLDATYAAELLDRQQSLQAEARQVLADLDLMSYLNRLGHAEHIGSSVSGLMVWRDLDVGVRCPLSDGAARPRSTVPPNTGSQSTG